MGKLVEDFAPQTSFGALAVETMIFQFVSEATFYAVHGSFRKAAAMIVNLFLPLLASFAADNSNRFIPCDWFGGRVAMLVNLGILTRWYDRSNLLCGQRLVHFQYFFAKIGIFMPPVRMQKA